MRKILGMIEGTEGTDKCMAERRNKGDEGREGLLLGRSVARVQEKVSVRIDRIVWEMCKSSGRGGII